MSIQKADAYLNAAKQNLAVMSVAIDANLSGVVVTQNVLRKQGWPEPEVAGIEPLLSALVEVVKAP